MLASGARPVLARRSRARPNMLAVRLSQAGNGTQLETAAAGTETRPPARDRSIEEFPAI